MANDDKIELEGVVEKAQQGGVFDVVITSEGFEGHKIRAKLSGKMRMYYIRIVPGDKVKCTVSHYNLEEGTIIYRPR